jgi:hypothetical protein
MKLDSFNEFESKKIVELNLRAATVAPRKPPTHPLGKTSALTAPPIVRPLGRSPALRAGGGCGRVGHLLYSGLPFYPLMMGRP